MYLGTIILIVLVFEYSRGTGVIIIMAKSLQRVAGSQPRFFLLFDIIVFAIATVGRGSCPP